MFLKINFHYFRNQINFHLALILAELYYCVFYPIDLAYSGNQFNNR
jgi:hypothetical protein